MPGVTPPLLALTAMQWILLLGFLVPVLVLWGYAIASLIRRPDLGGVDKAVWLAGILLLPVIGSSVYFMLRPAPQEQQRRAQARRQG